MSQRTTGWRRVFSVPAIYRSAQRAIGSERARHTLLNGYLQPFPNARVLDIGCGTGDLAALLPDVSYVGVDPSDAYITSARERRGTPNHEFRVGGAGDIDVEPGSFDICVAKGVLHHLDDEIARQLFDDAHRALRPGGRLVTMDPTFVSGQSTIARWLAERDRGQNVRTPDSYRELASTHFDEISVSEHHDLLRVPYSHAFLVCVR